MNCGYITKWVSELNQKLKGTESRHDKDGKAHVRNAKTTREWVSIRRVGAFYGLSRPRAGAAQVAGCTPGRSGDWAHTPSLQQVVSYLFPLQGVNSIHIFSALNFKTDWR